MKDGSGREVVIFEELADSTHGGSRALVTTFCDSSVSETRWRQLERLATVEWMRHDSIADHDKAEVTIIDLTDDDTGNFGPPAAKHLGPWAAE